jgi:hypothetical protein
MGRGSYLDNRQVALAKYYEALLVGVKYCIELSVPLKLLGNNSAYIDLVDLSGPSSDEGPFGSIT